MTVLMEHLTALKQFGENERLMTRGTVEGVRKAALLYTIGGTGIEYKLGATLWRLTGVLIKIKMHIHSDSAIPFLEI